MRSSALQRRPTNTVELSNFFITPSLSCCFEGSTKGYQEFAAEPVSFLLDLLRHGSTAVERQDRLGKLMLKQNVTHLVREAGRPPRLSMDRILDDDASPNGEQGGRKDCRSQAREVSHGVRGTAVLHQPVQRGRSVCRTAQLVLVDRTVRGDQARPLGAPPRRGAWLPLRSPYARLSLLALCMKSSFCRTDEILEIGNVLLRQIPTRPEQRSQLRH